jgi:hypothetical protein
VLVVVSERAARGQTSDEVARAILTLRRHNLKVLSHGAPHLEDARG